MTGEGIPNAHIVLYEKESQIFGSSTYTFVEDDFTNERGEYSFTSEIKGGTNYEVNANAERYWLDQRIPFPENKTIPLDPEGCDARGD